MPKYYICTVFPKRRKFGYATKTKIRDNNQNMKTKKFMMALCFLGGAIIPLPAQINGGQADSIIKRYVEQSVKEPHLVYSCADTLSGNLTIITWEDTLVCSNAYAYFIDEAPNANWNHPCRYVFVSKKEGFCDVFLSRTPASNVEWILKTSAGVPEREVAPSSVSSINEVPLKITTSLNPSYSYAVIINGGCDKEHNYERYWNNCSFMYKTLKDIYHYSEDHIYVIMSDGTNPAADRKLCNSGKYDSSPLDLDGNGTNDVRYSATRENISTVFNNLAEKLTEKDNLFIFMTGHGGCACKNEIEAGCL